MAQRSAATSEGWGVRRSKSTSKSSAEVIELLPFIRARGGNSYEINFKTAYSLAPAQMVDTVKAGMDARILVSIAARMGITNERLFSTLGLPRATADRKVRAKKALNTGESSRLLGIARLVGQVQTMVEESGNPEGFDAAQWVAQWLEEPMPALNGSTPASYMDTAEGQAIVSNLVARAQSGTYA